MTKKLNRITNIIGLLLVLAIAVIAAQPASAAAGTVSVTDGGDNIPFYGETVEFTWNSTIFAESTMYISIVNLSSRGASNTTWSFPGLTGMNQSTFIVNDNSSTAGQYVNNIAVSNYGGGGTTNNPWQFRYYLRNDTIPNSGLTSTGGLIGVYVNASTELMDLSGVPGNSATGRPSNYSVYLNAWNLSLYTNGTNRAVGGSPTGTSTLKGDRVQVTLNTYGVVNRDNVAWTLAAINDTGATVSGPTLAGSNTGTFTWNITTNTPGVLKNFTLSTGVSHYALNRKSDFIATNITAFALGLTKDTTANNGRYLQYNVSELNITTYIIQSGMNNQTFAAVNITSTDLTGTKVLQIIPYSVNLSFFTDSSDVSFSLGSRGSVGIASTIIHAGQGTNTTAPDYVYQGNYSFPFLANVSAVSSLPAIKTLTIQTNTSLTNFTASFNIQNPSDLITINTPAASSTFYVGDNITISGWNSTLGGIIFVNITGPSGVIPSGYQVYNTTASVNDIDGSWSVTWRTNDTWNSSGINGANGISYAPTGTYTITVSNLAPTANASWKATRTLTMSEDLVPTQSLTTMGPDDTLFINVTSNRRLANGSFVYLNLTSGNRVINNTLRGAVTDSTFNAATNTSFVNISWKPFWSTGNAMSQNSIESIGSPATISIKVNDTAVSNTSMTVIVTDSLTQTTTQATAGRIVKINGTSSRANGTPIWINISGNNYANATTGPRKYNVSVWGGAWNLTWWAVVDGSTNALAAGDYIVNVNDTIVSLNSTITLYSGALTVSAPSTATLDDNITISGTSGLPAGTVIDFNITSGVVLINNTIVNGMPAGFRSATVGNDGTFSTFWRINHSRELSGNFTGPSNSTYTIKANESGGLEASTTITITDPITVNVSRSSVVGGDSFNISGHTSRAKGTRINLRVMGSNIDDSWSISSATAAVMANGDFSVLAYAKSDVDGNTGSNLQAGTYTVIVNDTLNNQAVTINNATTSFTVGTATIGITSPTSLQVISNSTNITLSGISSRGATTGGVTFTISQASGGTYVNTSITANTLANGSWTTYWNTAGTHASGAKVTAGTYTIIATTSGVSAAVTVTIAEPSALNISASPTSVTVGTPTDVTFSVTNAGTAVSGATVTLSGNATGSNTTDASGNAIISVNATVAGAITATATKNGYTQGTTTITASAAPTVTVTVNGTDTVGIYRTGGAYYLRNNNSAGNADLAFIYGITSDTPLAGDWDASGNDTVGIYRTGGAFYLKNSNSAGSADLAFIYGITSDTPLVGNWDGIGNDTVGIYRNGSFYLKNSNSAGSADLAFVYGVDGDIPLVGDWNGDGVDTVGIYRSGAFYLKNSNSAGSADLAFIYGVAGDTPLVGDWDGDGVDTVGIYRSGTFYLKNSNSAGSADLAFVYGISGDTPLVGDWDNQ